MALTKSQIIAKIKEKEDLKIKYENERDDYNKSIEYSGKIIKNLKACVTNYLSPANDSLKKYFTIDGKSADEGTITEIINEIDSIVDYMNDDVVSDLVYYRNHLNEKISNLDNQIYNLWVEYNYAES